jgi:hypothetical protein
MIIFISSNEFPLRPSETLFSQPPTSPTLHPRELLAHEVFMKIGSVFCLLTKPMGCPKRELERKSRQHIIA